MPKPNGRRRSTAASLLKDLEGSVVKIDLGGGAHPQPGCLNMDVRDLPEVDIRHDWESIPWPFPDSCATLIIANVVEHVNPARFGFINWMNECWRVLKYDGQLMLTTPFAGSLGYWSDPTHVNPCTNRTWDFFDPLHPSRLYFQYKPKPWRIQNCFWNTEGNMEVLLVKRREDPSYA